jgi:hypothetical protein
MLEAGRRPVSLGRVPALAEGLQLDRLDHCKVALADRHPEFYRALVEPETVKLTSSAFVTVAGLVSLWACLYSRGSECLLSI